MQQSPPRPDVDRLALTAQPPVPAALPVEDHEPLPPADDEPPAVEQLISVLDRMDRLAARATQLAGSLLGADAAARGGLPLEQLVGLEAGWTRSDRRMLLTAADTLRHLPAVRAGLEAATLSWGRSAPSSPPLSG